MYFKGTYREKFIKGTYPEKIKYIIITPVYKKGENKIENYIPISIIPHFSKILNKLLTLD